MKLEICGISKTFGSQQVLAEIDLTLENLHTLVLIGPSGSGKSTLLRILAGLEHSDAGKICLNGEAIPSTEASLLAYRQSIGTVFQSFNLFPHLTAFENIALPLRVVHGRSVAEAAETAHAMLDRFQLAAHTHKRNAELSGGQRQRVAIARAVSIRPRLLLFDEPTSALDPEMTAEVLDLISELRSEGRDIVLVTHEMGFARQIADSVAFLADGRLLETGPADAVFDAPVSAAARQFFSRILKY